MSDFSPLEQAIAEAYACAPQNVVILHTLEINHKSFTQPARVVRWPVTDNEPSVFHCRLEDDAPYDPGKIVDFIGLPFELIRPGQSADNPGQFQIRIDNIGDELDEHLEGAVLSGEEITGIYREFIKGSEKDGPCAISPNIKIPSPHMEGLSIVVPGVVLNWMSRPFGELYTPENSPGLVRGR